MSLLFLALAPQYWNGFDRSFGYRPPDQPPERIVSAGAEYAAAA
jgi:hypothetical protein